MIIVSVIVVTYNHERYIRQALQSIVDQEVDFKYEIIVANDASTDNTLAIIQEFDENYPGLFVIRNNERNLGVLKNVSALLDAVQGKYYALLDGDDYWDYPEKLQHQVEFLECNLAYNGVFHDAQIIMEDEKAEQLLFANKYLYSQSYYYKEVIFPSDLVNRLILPSSSAVFRTDRSVIKDFHLLKDDFSVAWKLSCLVIKDAKFYYINKPWSVYRNHQKGISKSRNQEFHNSHIEFLKQLKKDAFYKDYKYDLYKSISHEYMVLLDTEEKNNKKMFFKYLRNEIKRIYHFKKQMKS